MEMIQKVLGFDNYEIDMTDFFNVKVFSLNYRNTGKRVELKPDNKYSQVTLCENGIHNVFGAHQLVWRQFNGEIPDGYDIHHNNLDSSDNRPENLLCIEHSKHMELHAKLKENQGLSLGCSKKKKCLQFDKDGNLIKEWKSTRDACRYYGHGIRNCLIGKSKTAYGFIWRYSE